MSSCENAYGNILEKAKDGTDSRQRKVAVSIVTDEEGERRVP